MLVAHARSQPLAWPRVARFFEDDPPKNVEFGTPDPNQLYEFALRYEQSSKTMFSRELAAIWSVADGILIEEMWWYLAPVKKWSWEDEGLHIGCGHYSQGSLCIEATLRTKNLAEAPVVDRDDDGVETYRYQNLAALFELLLPGRDGGTAGMSPSSKSSSSGSPASPRGPRKFWA
jgi:hypothetical protein